MSHWGATVITNLLSAIPFIGNDIVPFNLILPLYFICPPVRRVAELSSAFIYINLYLTILYNNSKPANKVGSRAKLGYDYYINNISILSYITCQKIYTFLVKFKDIPEEEINNETGSVALLDHYKPAQGAGIRPTGGPKKDISIIDINLILLYKFIGFIDGDGYIRVTKKSKYKDDIWIIDYIYISLVINLNENELDLLNKFNTELKLGKVYYITPKKGNKLARLEINKTDIKNILIPLLDHYKIQFLTETRQRQYLLAKFILNNNIIKYNDINKYQNDINNYINNNLIKYKFNKLSYFNYWLVGFTMAEGSFLKKRNKDICFQLKQKYNFELFNNIKKVFNINKGISINKDKYIQLSISSKKDIQKVIYFFNDDNNHLLGYKNIQYKKWLLDLKSNNRYKNLYINSKI